MSFHDYPRSPIESLENLKREIDKTIENIDKDHDEEHRRLLWMEKDFTPRDDKTTYYLMIKIAEPKYEGDFFKIDVSDGMARTGMSAPTLEEALVRAREEAQDKLQRNIDNEWKLNER